MRRLLDRVAAPLRAAHQILRRAWARLRAWRRIRFTSGGIVFTIGSLAVGFAAVNTGNNLLYLLLGSMLGFMVVSGWFSERMIRDLDVVRRVPRGVTVGHDVRIFYELHSRRRRLPTLAVEIGEQGLAEKAYLARLAAGQRSSARSVNRFVRRGIYPLPTLTLSTSFPFGLFVKERDLRAPGELVVWPRSDRSVRPPVLLGGQQRQRTLATAGAPGARGEYRGLREYRVGDDPRDIHWKSSARLRQPVVREYDVDAAEDLWIVLDTRGEPGEAAEVAVEVAASLAAESVRHGNRFGLVTGEKTIMPGSGPGQLEMALDALARADFRPDSPRPAPPTERSRCVLVSSSGRDRHEFGDAYVTGDAA